MKQKKRCRAIVFFMLHRCAIRHFRHEVVLRLTNSVQNSIYAPHAEQAQQQKWQNGAFVAPSFTLQGKDTILSKLHQQCVSSLSVKFCQSESSYNITHKQTNAYIHDIHAYTCMHTYIIQQTYITVRHTDVHIHTYSQAERHICTP